jgi:MEMO1 family protein
MTDKYILARRDLELFPVQQDKEQFIVIKDALGLVEEGKALSFDLYWIMTLLDGTKSLRDIQMELIRNRGGVLVGVDELEELIAHLDESFLLDTARYREAKKHIENDFFASKIRPCSHCGSSYPREASELKIRLDEIIESQAVVSTSQGNLKALIAPHIDLSVGSGVYGSAYQQLKNISPSRVIILGVGHRMTKGLFCLTEKDFQTPFGIVTNDRGAVKKLEQAGSKIISENDFVHKAEHSVEFQVIFLQHLLAKDSFTIIPILCGSLIASLSEYTREAYREAALPFLLVLSELIREKGKETLIVAGVDFSHTGPKFGHNMSASYLEFQSKQHDKKLLNALSKGDPDSFWEESIGVKDKFNVCGFSAMATLLEVLPPLNGKVLKYQTWHEQLTQSAVSFSAVAFTCK